MRFLCIVLLMTSLVHAGDFIPMDVNNQANFETYSTISAPQVNCTIDARSGNWFHFNRFGAFYDVWLKERFGRLWITNGNDPSEALADFYAPKGTRWDISVIGGATWAEVAERGTVTLPYGTYKTLKMIYGRDTLGWPPMMTHAIFAEGLGLIEWAGVGPADGIETYHMFDCTMNGVLYKGKPSPVVLGPLKVSVTASGNTFAEPAANPYCRDCPGTAPEVFLSLEFTNMGEFNYPLFFTSSQTFDIEIIDSEGNLIKRWSDGRFFLMATRTYNVAPEETFSVGGSIAMNHESGRPLLPGKYTLRMYLKGYDIEGVTPFEIVPRY